MPKIAIVGDFWNQSDEATRSSFNGAPGYILREMLKAADISLHDCYLTTAFEVVPKPTLDISNLCSGKKDSGHDLPPLATGKYIRAEYLPHVARLEAELRTIKPNIIICMGGAALWALTREGGIIAKRGAVAASPLGKIIAMYHPSSIIKEFSNRHITILDLMKAKREAEFPEVRRPQRFIHIDPTLDEMEQYYETYLRDARILSVDIETKAGQITCIGFAASHDRALVVPFWDGRFSGGNYWKDADEEQLAWKFVTKCMQARISKLFQNGLYDVNILWGVYGIPTAMWQHDTMLLHHALYIEAKKGLGFLGSAYTNEASWKIMRSKTLKKEA